MSVHPDGASSVLCRGDTIAFSKEVSDIYSKIRVNCHKDESKAHVALWYAAYEYLHRLGMRWYTPEAIKIPTLERIVLPSRAYRYNPPIISRSQLVGNKPNDQWSACDRLN